MTGLSNRLLLHERLEHATKRAERTDLSVAVVFIDLDDFKGVNDAYGHPIGDELLISIARRLSETARSGDTLARFSGDEFVFLCENLRNHRELDLLTRRIQRVFSEPFFLAQSGLTVLIRASVGTAFAAPGTDISKELIAEADIAMYEAKRRRVAGR